MTHAELAEKNFSEGMTCSQAVLLAFSDVTGLDKDVALRISSSFGGGMGRLREVCGAVSGMFMVAGLLYGGDLSQDRSAKAAHYARIQELAAAFREENGSIICRQLLACVPQTAGAVPEERSPQYYKKRPCAQYCYEAAAILDRYIAEHPPTACR